MPDFTDVRTDAQRQELLDKHLTVLAKTNGARLVARVSEPDGYVSHQVAIPIDSAITYSIRGTHYTLRTSSLVRRLRQIGEQQY